MIKNTICAFFGFCIGLCSYSYIIHAPVQPSSIIPANMAKKATGWGAALGSNRVAFQTEQDLQIFQSFDAIKQQLLIVNNNNTTVHFTTKTN